jgi:hypothetical protein
MALAAPSILVTSSPATESSFTNPDWLAIGLVLAIVGSFLLANSILFRHPRQLIRERFGRETQELRTIREYIFHRVQVNLGFGFLLAGFALQLFGRFRPLPADVDQAFPTLWIGIVVILAVVLLLGSWWWSLLAFRRYVRQYFRDHPPDFEADLALAREVGELFGLPSHGDDTVQSYVTRLRMHLCAPARPEPPRRRLPVQLEREEPELEEGLA